MSEKASLKNPLFEDYQVKRFALNVGQYHEPISCIFVEDLPVYYKAGKHQKMTFVFKVFDDFSHLYCQTFCDSIHRFDGPPELVEHPDFPHPERWDWGVTSYTERAQNKHVLFSRSEASEFAQKHRYQIFNELKDGSFPEQTHTDSNFSGGKYEPWLYGEKVKNILNTDDAGLLHLIKEGVLVAHTQDQKPLAVEYIDYMMNDPVGQLLPDWPPSGFDGLKFREDEVLRFAKSLGINTAVDEDEEGHQIAPNRADDEVSEKSSTPEEEGQPENVIAPAKIFLQLEPEDHVRIKIPGKDAEIIHIIDLGFRSATTNAAGVFKVILEKGEYLPNSAANMDLIKQVEKKLQEYFKSKEKFL